MLDSYSHWMPSMIRNTAEQMDGGVGLGDYSGPSFPFGGSSGCSHKET